jgi:hypothetical protein
MFESTGTRARRTTTDTRCAAPGFPASRGRTGGGARRRFASARRSSEYGDGR